MSKPYLSELDIKLSLKDRESKTAPKVDLLDEIEACLLSDPNIISPRDNGGVDYEGECFSHTDLDSLSSDSSDSLDYSDDYEFDQQLASLSSIANQMSPFFSKLNHLSHTLSKSTSDLEKYNSVKTPESPLASNSSLSWTDVPDGPQSEDCVYRHQVDTWSCNESSSSSPEAPSVCSLPGCDADHCPKRPKPLTLNRDSFASDCSSPLFGDAFSPVNTHRISIMSLKSAFTFLSEKGTCI